MPFTVLPVSLILAAGCAFLNLWLSIRIGQVRRRERVFVGDAGSEPLVRRMRAQANFVENAPLVLALVVLIELCAGTDPWLWSVAALFLVARVAHAIGMDGWGRGRMLGTGVTMAIQLALAVWAIAIAIPIVAHHDGRPAPTETVVPAG